jgi:Putative Actinobacterial Holin-X, holin superfamily III
VPERDTPQSLAGQVSEFVNTTKAYAKQETLGPLKHVGRFLFWGILGSILISIGAVLSLLGLLRLLQTHNDGHLTGSLTWVPYLIVLFAAAVVIGLSVWRILQNPLKKKGAK